MAKIPAKRVPSDDFTVTVEGVEYHPHEGEWVEIRPTMSVKSMKRINQLMAMQYAADSIDGDEDEKNIRMIELMTGYFDDITEAIETRVIGWNWTDNDGEPMPQPSAPGWIDVISIDEMMYLLGVLGGGESKADAKND